MIFENMLILREFFKTQSDQNIHQNARAYLRGGGVQGVQTPPKFLDFF